MWRAWAEPKQLAQWWGPKGLSTPLDTIELDPGPGGAFRLTMVSDATGSEFPTDMEFREVVEPDPIVFRLGGSARAFAGGVEDADRQAGRARGREGMTS